MFCLSMFSLAPILIMWVVGILACFADQRLYFATQIETCDINCIMLCVL